MFNNLIDIERLTSSEILSIIDEAEGFKNGSLKPSLEGKTAALMFFENSTRTKCSFDLAAQRLGMNVLNFDTAHSSINKGESLKDTLENLYFIGVDVAIIRHSMSGIIDNAIDVVKYPMSFVNAGDGNRAHPTQALLDFMTIREKRGNIEGKKIAIIGDIKHSRVAKSNLALLNKFGADVHLCAPIYFRPEGFDQYNATWHLDLKSAIKDADVVMMLRIQNERLNGEMPDVQEYVKDYGLNSDILNKLAKPNAILMHPGPVNRNVEITSELLDSERGKTILEQAQNGVFVRMAVLNHILAAKKEVCFAS